jgi:preprotein translocase subunit SecG
MTVWLVGIPLVALFGVALVVLLRRRDRAGFMALVGVNALTVVAALVLLI